MFRIKIKAESASNYRVNVQTKHYSFIVDEPVSFGGGNEGPGPIDYFLSGFVGCFNGSSRIVAKERNLDIRNIRYEVECEMEQLDAGEVGKSRAIFHVVAIRVQAESDLDSETIDSWLKESSERCAVSYAIRMPIPVSVSSACLANK